MKCAQLASVPPLRMQSQKPFGSKLEHVASTGTASQDAALAHVAVEGGVALLAGSPARTCRTPSDSRRRRPAPSGCPSRGRGSRRRPPPAGARRSSFCATMSGVAQTGTSTLRAAVNVTWSTAAWAGSPSNSTGSPLAGARVEAQHDGARRRPVRPGSPAPASSADRSGVRSAGPRLVVEPTGPATTAPRRTVVSRLLRSLAVLVNVCALVSSSADDAARWSGPRRSRWP